MVGVIRGISVGVVTLCLAGVCVGAEPGEPARKASAPIRISNFQDGEVIQYPVPLIRGELADAGRTFVTVVNTSSKRETHELKGLAYKGRFKALTELVPGENRLIIRSGSDELPLKITYRPQTTHYFVRCIYFTDSSGATEYQSPVPNDPQNYAAKLDTAMKVLQTFTAERHHDLGFGRRTFNLELDADGKVKVHLFKGSEPASFYYAMPDGDWWGRTAQEIEKAFPMEHAKNVVIAAFTRLDPATGKLSGHTALGGGWLGLFGSGNLFTWPGSLAQVQPAFMDTRPIDPKQVMSDSVGRHTFWGAASTTMGATLHELAHTFGLPHTREPYDIMTRGFDYLNRAFTFVDPPCAGRAEAVEFKDEEVACFAPISAAALAPSRWFAMTERPFRDGGQITVKADESAKTVVIRADHLIRYIGFDVDGDAAHFVVPAAGQREVSVAVAEVCAKVKADHFHVRAIDDQGGTVVEEVKGELRK